MNALVTSTRAEWLRLRKWPATWVVIGVWLALNITFVYVLNYVSYRTGDANFANEGVTREVLLADVLPSALPQALIAGAPLFGGAIVLILGALAVGSGYGWGTWKTAFTQGPGRLSAFTGTLAAVVMVLIVITVATFAVDLTISFTLAQVESVDIVWPSVAEIAEAAGGLVLVLAMWALGGALIGTLARGPALAVGLGLVWIFAVEGLLRSLGGLWSPLGAVTDMMPGTAAGSLAGALIPPPTTPGDGTPGVLTVLDQAPATWLLAAYVVVFAVASMLLVRRRDVT
jgi:ABC-type transport system involved in multi-copper enzyme maturation permease subunit